MTLGMTLFFIAYACIVMVCIHIGINPGWAYIAHAISNYVYTRIGYCVCIAHAVLYPTTISEMLVPIARRYSTYHDVRASMRASKEAIAALYVL